MNLRAATTVILLVLLSLPAAVCAQEAGFLGIHIGMSRGEVITTAESTALIEVPKNRDVEFFPVEDRKILTLSVKPEVPFMYCQFYDEVLFSLTVVFDERYVDYFTLVQRLEARYGRYDRIEPSFREWEIGSVLIKVEKPATVKYIALEDLLQRTSFGRKDASSSAGRRETLLEGL
jgi:hypothetical protein